MNLIFSAKLPIPPSVNHYTKARKGGGRFLSKEARAYKEAVSILISSVSPSEPFGGRLLGKFTFCFKDKRRRDLDNYMKLAQDSLQGAVFVDDCQFDELILKRGEKVAGGALWVEIYEMEVK